MQHLLMSLAMSLVTLPVACYLPGHLFKFFFNLIKISFTEGPLHLLVLLYGRLCLPMFIKWLLHTLQFSVRHHCPGGARPDDLV